MQEEFEKEHPRPPTFYWCDHQDEYVSDARDEEQLEHEKYLSLIMSMNV